MTLLVIYDRRARKTLGIREFSDSERDEALRARFAAEDAHRSNPDIEVVMLSSACRRSLERVYSRYFREPRR